MVKSHCPDHIPFQLSQHHLIPITLIIAAGDASERAGESGRGSKMAPEFTLQRAGMQIQSGHFNGNASYQQHWVLNIPQPEPWKAPGTLSALSNGGDVMVADHVITRHTVNTVLLMKGHGAVNRAVMG